MCVERTHAPFGEGPTEKARESGPRQRPTPLGGRGEETDGLRGPRRALLRPYYNLLEGSFQLQLVNPERVKAYARRKTDLRDAEWLADLLRHGLLEGSFVPSKQDRELRELTRYRAALVAERTAELNRLQKILEGANIKLASVASDIDGVSARQMLEMLVAGSEDATAMADLARGQLRKKIPELEKALTGRFGPHQRFMVSQVLAHLDGLEEVIEQVSAEIEARMRPFEEAVGQLDTIPGVGRQTAQAIVAEIGVDMSRFATSGHLASWAGVCPGNDQSAGKQRSGKTGKGSKWLRVALIQAAHAAGHTNKSYLSAQYHRLASRLGKKKAVIAVAHSILVIAYHLLDRHESYRDLGASYFDQRNKEATQKRLVHRLEALGFQVSLTPVVLAA